MKQKLLATLVATFSLAAGAASAAPSSVATITSVKGQVIIENAEGVRSLAKADMTLAEGSNLIVLENGKVGLQYQASQCKINHDKNSLVAISEKAQCAAGKQVSVGQAGRRPQPTNNAFNNALRGAGPSNGALGGVSGGVATGGVVGGTTTMMAALGGVAAAAAAAAAGSTNDLRHCYDKNGPEPSCPNYVDPKTD